MYDMYHSAQSPHTSGSAWLDGGQLLHTYIHTYIHTYTYISSHPPRPGERDHLAAISMYPYLFFRTDGQTDHRRLRTSELGLDSPSLPLAPQRGNSDLSQHRNLKLRSSPRMGVYLHSLYVYISAYMRSPHATHTHTKRPRDRYKAVLVGVGPALVRLQRGGRST